MIVHEVYKNGAADKDGRLQPGDRIVSVNGTAFNELTHEEALRILRSSQDRVRSMNSQININHKFGSGVENHFFSLSFEQVVVVIDPKTGDASDIYQDLEVELTKKPGKGLGLSVVGRRDGNGVFISDMVFASSDFRVFQKWRHTFNVKDFVTTVVKPHFIKLYVDHEGGNYQKIT